MSETVTEPNCKCAARQILYPWIFPFEKHFQRRCSHIFYAGTTIYTKIILCFFANFLSIESPTLECHTGQWIKIHLLTQVNHEVYVGVKLVGINAIMLYYVLQIRGKAYKPQRYWKYMPATADSLRVLYPPIMPSDFSPRWAMACDGTKMAMSRINIENMRFIDSVFFLMQIYYNKNNSAI